MTVTRRTKPPKPTPTPQAPSAAPTKPGPLTLGPAMAAQEQRRQRTHQQARRASRRGG